MIRRLTLSIAGFVFLFAASAHAQDEAGCNTARYKAGSKFASCENKTAADGFNNDAFFKCRAKYAATWNKLVKKYTGTSCAGARFVDNGDGTITDKLTQLVWEKKDSFDSMNNPSNPHDAENNESYSADNAHNADGTAFTAFLATLNSTGFAGQHDWRLPTLFELHTIVAVDAVPCATPPCLIDPIFLPAYPYFALSSTPEQGGPGTWGVQFGTGENALGGTTAAAFVRAVRAGSFVDRP